MKFNKFGNVAPGSSLSNEYLNKKQSSPPPISRVMVNQMSFESRAALEQDVYNGLYSDGSSNNFNYNLTNNSIVTGAGLKKTAQLSTSNPFSTGGPNTFNQLPEIYSPLWLTSNLSLPRDRATINAWCRAFYALNPVVNAAINFHSTYPINKLQIKCHNPRIQDFFNNLIEELDLLNICIDIAREYYLLGEAFPYAELDETKGKWSRIVLQNPDFMVVKPSIVPGEPVIMIRPDENLKQIVRSTKPGDIEQRKKLSQNIIEAVKRGENILLNNINVHHLAKKIAPYENRGTGLPVCIFRQLMLFDQIRESKYAQANNMINPLTLFKIGSADYKPTYADIEAWRETVEAAQSNKDFKIFTHDAVSVERIGYGQGIYDVSGDITQLLKEMYVGLELPQVLMDGGADTTYANGGVALEALKQRYLSFRNLLSTWLKRKIFAPISKINGFYEYKPGTGKTVKKLIIPEVEWNHLSLFDTGDYIQNLITLTSPTSGAPEGTPNRVSVSTLYRSLGLDEEDESRKLRKEAIKNEIYKKEVAALATMSLNELRALDENEDIPEPIEDKDQSVPGEAGSANSNESVPGTSAGESPPPMSFPSLK